MSEPDSVDGPFADHQNQEAKCPQCGGSHAGLKPGDLMPDNVVLRRGIPVDKVKPDGSIRCVMQNRRSLLNLVIVPALRIEPAGMFEEGEPIPDEAKSLQRLFRKATRGTPFANVEFILGSELLLPIASLMSFLHTVAQICSHEVTTIGGAELAGGYAFPENGVYVFGVEDDSTLYDTSQWDDAPELLRKYGEARIRHACDHFILARQEGETVSLRQEKSGDEYLMNFKRFNEAIQKASSQLQEFAVAFTPIYAQYLAIENANDAAFENFRNRPHWFAHLKKHGVQTEGTFFKGNRSAG